MKADNSLPVVGQSFKELCNLPTSFTLSWNSRVKLDAGWTSVVESEGSQRPRQESECGQTLSHSATLRDALYRPSGLGTLTSAPQFSLQTPVSDDTHSGRETYLCFADLAFCQCPACIPCCGCSVCVLLQLERHQRQLSSRISSELFYGTHSN